ncbi:hypothetical protein CN198_13960 [Sinorhizobium meliloti]|uniref:hypothetical protein n=1 Tax=Rhizobium meliloti TaxID=382 RepID=UPI000FDBC801|nr:hypothetical protein [Sinorhizobium meliloti]RVH69167.1 hypothetical protein CN198_13960 [Sinorhizobium meliloti]
MRSLFKFGTFTFFTFSSLLSSASWAQERSPFPEVTKFGISFLTSVKEIYDANNAPTVVPSNADKATQQIGQLVDRYKQDMRVAAASANLVKANGELIISTAAIGGASTGVGAVPTAVVSSLAYWGNSAFAKHLQDEAEGRAKQVLAGGLRTWDTASGVTYEDVQTMIREGKADEAAQAFDKATGALSFMRGELVDYPEGEETAQKLLFRTIVDTSRATLEQVGLNTEDVEALQKEFGRHVAASKRITEETKNRLTGIENRLDDLQTNLNEGFESLQRITNANASQINLIGDVLFGQQSAEVKIRMLGNPDFKKDLTPEARTDLIKVLEVQKNKDDIIRESANVISNIQGIHSIMTSLGVSNPDIAKAVNVASVAQTAMSQALSGNYIGAIAGALGVFGGGSPSPDEQRFKAIMGFLEVMDEKLDKIIELQQKTLQAINSLSIQLSEVERRLNERLDVIDAVVKTTSKNLRSLMWAEYLSCQKAYEDRNVGGNTPYNEENETFKTVKDLYAYMGSSSAGVLDCANKLDSLFISIKNNKVFGQLLSLRTASTSNFSVAPEEDEKRVYNKEELEGFLNGIYIPSWSVIAANWKGEWGHPANALAMLSSPSATTDGVRRRFNEIAERGGLNACNESSLLSWRLRSLLCATTRYAPRDASAALVNEEEIRAQERFFGLMQDPIVRDQLPVLIEWAAFSARPYDLWTGSGDTYFKDIEDLARNGRARGKDLLWGILTVVDLGIAQRSMLHGDMTAKFVYDLIWDKAKNVPIKVQVDAPEPLKNASLILENTNNPWLAQNVLVFAMEDSLRSDLAGADIRLPYQSALDPFLDETMTSQDRKRVGHTFLKSIFKFDDSVDYDVREDPQTGAKRVYIIFPGDKPLAIRMPTPEEFQKRAMVYPEDLYDLIRARDMLSERLVDYELLSGLQGEALEVTVSVLFHGINSKKSQ